MLRDHDEQRRMSQAHDKGFWAWSQGARYGCTSGLSLENWAWELGWKLAEFQAQERLCEQPTR